MLEMTLTDRYITATIRSLPTDSQENVQAELGASIDDAERDVLPGLGDPAALVASYADRPLHLIGPRFYLAWWRLLKLLLLIVPASVMGAVALGKSLTGDPVGEVIGSAIADGIGTVRPR